MANNICEYVEMINIQLLIRRILDMVSDSHKSFFILNLIVNFRLTVELIIQTVMHLEVNKSNLSVKYLNVYCFVDIANQMRQQVDPIVSIGVIGYALLAILMIIMILPNQVDRRSSSNLSNKRNVNNQNGRNNGFDDDDHNDNIT